MPVYQAFNKRIGAWVKYDFKKGKNDNTYANFFDVKEKEPRKPFKGVKKRGQGLK